MMMCLQLLETVLQCNSDCHIITHMFNLVALYVSLSIVNNSNSPFVVIDDALLYMLKTCAQVCDVLYNIVSMQLTDTVVLVPVL